MAGEQTPLLKRDEAIMGNQTPAGIPGLPHTFTQTPPSSSDPSATTSSPRRLPQAIAHRGYKAAAPENSMLAFRAAVEAGAHAIETDLHLSKDGVVVLSHDPSLKRCFGLDVKVRDCEWSYLRELKTLREPAQPMPSLRELLEYLNEPGREHVWIMLDIKRDDDATEMMQKTAETIASVPGIRPWHERILPCCWTTEYIKLSMQYLPDFPVAHVGFSSTYARALAQYVPSMSISMLYATLALPFFGPRFIRDMKRAGHPVHSWTVNDEDWMEWAIKRELDGVVTDDPKLFLEVCRRAAEEGKEGGALRRTRVRIPLRRRLTRAIDWGRYFVFTIIITTIYLFKWGLPQRSVRKTFGK
ncbi:PLC-like phosphodiesterase [Hypomontagnella monticulosa]|nr:PLC-like phosphodiesterase [Hypomontagnella monticulosa]